MDWFKVMVKLSDLQKWDDLTDGAARALLNIWCYVARHDPAHGHVPATIARLVPRVTPARVRELERAGWLDRNGDGGGWVVHDWEEHQAEAVAIERRKAADRERKKAARRKEPSDAK